MVSSTGIPTRKIFILNENAKLCIIDFGLVGRLRTDQKNDLITMVVAVLIKNVTTISRVFLRMGTPLKRVNLLQLRADIACLQEYGISMGDLSLPLYPACTKPFCKACHWRRLSCKS